MRKIERIYAIDSRDFSSYEAVKRNFNSDSLEVTWRNAKFLYEQCSKEMYKEYFLTQTEFARYLGISKGMLSKYITAYRYYLKYQEKINLSVCPLEYVYLLHRKIGDKLMEFIDWMKIVGYQSIFDYNIRSIKAVIDEYLLENCYEGNAGKRNMSISAEEEELIGNYRRLSINNKERIQIQIYNLLSRQ